MKNINNFRNVKGYINKDNKKLKANLELNSVKKAIKNKSSTKS